MKLSTRPLSRRTGTLTTMARFGLDMRSSTPGSRATCSATVSSCRQAIWKVGELSKRGIGWWAWPLVREILVGVVAPSPPGAVGADGAAGAGMKRLLHVRTGGEVRNPAAPWSGYHIIRRPGELGRLRFAATRAERGERDRSPRRLGSRLNPGPSPCTYTPPPSWSSAA